ncbi:MAG: hypothetical protein ACNA7O_04970 [Rhodobacterales bacterium]
MPQGEKQRNGWAEERLCKEWKADIDPNDPAHNNAEALKKISSLTKDAACAESRPAFPQSLIDQIFGWLSGKDRASR